MFAAPPLAPGPDGSLGEEGLHTFGSDQPGKITPANLEPNDCGHPPRMHTCARGVTRIRMMTEQAVPVGDPVVCYLRNAWELVHSETIANRTCDIIPGTVSRTLQKVNSYSLSDSGSASVTAEVGLSSSPYMPMVVQAKASASAGVTITNEMSRQETMTYTTAVVPNVGVCRSVTVDVYWLNALVEVKQPFVTRAICNIQGGSNPNITICNPRTVVATSQGSNTWYTDIHGAWLGEDCCPSPPPPPPGPPAGS